MKAILVVDVPAEMINDNTCVTIAPLHSGMSFNAKLKPMPKKKIIIEDMVLDQYYWDLVNYFGGWNNCINEILGEEDDS